MSTPVFVDGIELGIDENTTVADLKDEVGIDTDTILAYRDGVGDKANVETLPG